MTVFYILGGYVINVVLTYLIQRLIFIVSNHPEEHPVWVMILLCFVPIIGIGASLYVLGVEYLYSDNRKPMDYKKTYRIK